jgi:phage terminase small subunit
MPRARKDEDGLTPKQKAFVLAFVNQTNADSFQAAKIAGYSGTDEVVRSIGHENLRKPHIWRAIKAEREVQAGPFDWGPRARARLCFEIASDPDAKPADRLKAVELMCKMDGSFTERRIVEGKVEMSFAAQREQLRALLLDENVVQAADVIATAAEGVEA